MSRKQPFLPPDLNAYDKGVQKGVDVAISSEKLNIKKQNPHSPFLSPKAFVSFSQGLKEGYRIGIKQREFQRLRELSKIGNKRDRGRGR